MVVYANQNGVTREFSDISIVNVKDGIAQLVQHLASTENGSQSFERRRADIPIMPSETRDELFARLNDNANIVINKNGALSTMQMSV